MIARKICYILLFCQLVFACSPDIPDDVSIAYKEVPENPDYNRHVKPILSDKCFSCHGPDKSKQEAGLRLDLPASAYGVLPENPGKVAIDPGNPEGSELFHRILSSDAEYRMPTPESHLSLSANEKAILIRWIENGAVYKPHWSFVKPEEPELPPASPWTVNEIDRFVLAKLKQEKRNPSPESDKELLLRRVTFDLTGLPPSIAEMDAFLADTSANAYEKVVDRLLRSPHYGEKMATDWLDLSRFADSHGYTVDRLRDMSPYRDWVISAFNKNQPYDQFIHWQMAGDLMPQPNREMLIATAFNRNHPQNLEGGIIEQEFQTEYVVDRTNTLGDAFLGITLSCARCHDHKFDPVSQKEYYQLFSFFNNVKEAGQISWDDAMPSPTILLPLAEQEKVIAFLKNSINDQENLIQKSMNEAEKDFEKWIQSAQYKKLGKHTIPSQGLTGKYHFDQGKLKNETGQGQTGSMRRELHNAPGDPPVFEEHNRGKALILNGDEWLDLTPVGVFRKADPFTISMKVYIPASLREGVIFHKSIAERLYNYRGFHVYLKDKRFEAGMSHAAPSNAITKISKDTVARNQWIQLTLTWDGSGKAKGLKLYQDGRELSMSTEMDQLEKDIFLYTGTQPGLQIGAWSRGWGLKGGKVDDIYVYNRQLTPYEVRVLNGSESWKSITDKPLSEWSKEELSSIKEYYLEAEHPGLQKHRMELRQLRIRLADSTEKLPELMVMQEMTTPKKTFVLQRGNYDAPGHEVLPSTPASILAYPKDLPKNRYGLALWITHPDNPLTARVAVNRYWQMFFGSGLVKTAEDFGNQGEMPSHPELLDWLAVNFRESGWDVKKLCKQIVMSATYRQDSKITPELMERDPENRLLARGPSLRLTAEMIRDNVLQASGLLNKTIGGKSVKPYQPGGLWEINNTSYVADTGSLVYRRSLYVLVKRSVPNPTLSTFDAGSRSYCVVRRQQTNTPLQALVTLNDPTFLEAAKAMGIMMVSVTDNRNAVATAFRKLTGRKPLDKETDLLLELRNAEYEKFKKYPEKMKGWLNAGQLRIPGNIDLSAVAANAVVANTIMNADAALVKR